MRILVIGHTGMLGNAVHRYLQQYYIVDTIDYRWPTEYFVDYIRTYGGDYIINCIGAIPQKTNDFGINSILPVFLELNSNCKIIHPATDCESDNSIYGISKHIATEWPRSNATKTYIFKTSIIGIELNTTDSLLCWFLNQSKANGYTQAKWNGITTLEWAKQCKHLIENQNLQSTYTVFNTNCISKFELLTLIKEVFNHDAEIHQVDNIGSDKCLLGHVELKDIKQQLLDLKEFYER